MPSHIAAVDVSNVEVVSEDLKGGDYGDLALHALGRKRWSRRVGRLIYNGVPTGVRVCEAMVHGHRVETLLL